MHEQLVRIAGITIAIRCGDPRVTCVYEGAVTRFLITDVPGDGEASDSHEPGAARRRPWSLDFARDLVELDVVFLEQYEPPAGPLLFDSGAVWRMFEEGDGVRIECQSDMIGSEPYKVATFDRDFTRGTIRVNLSKPVDPIEYPLDELLVANLLGRGRGVELHGCGVIDQQGRGHLFVGQSGAGKTTTARMWGSDAREIVSDDRVIVREIDGELRMFGTPWHGEAELASPASAPLAGVYLLTQAKENELRALPDAVAVARLFGCTFPPFHDPEAVAFMMSMLERIVARVPVREMRFTLDRDAVLKLIA